MIYAISSDSDNQDNNYTKPDSSINVTYHLSNQAIKKQKREGRKGRILVSDSLFRMSVELILFGCSHKLRVDGVT